MTRLRQQDDDYNSMISIIITHQITPAALLIHIETTYFAPADNVTGCHRYPFPFCYNTLEWCEGHIIIHVCASEMYLH